VTGARKGTSHDLLYHETNWMTLAERRSLNKLKIFAKIIEGKTPEYLKSLIPNQVKSVRPNSRYGENYLYPKNRIEIFRKSFIVISILY
jgi:hypothetical protein